MSLRVEATLGLALRGSGAAFPADLGQGLALPNAELYQVLLGGGWEAELERRGWRADHPETAWGVARRDWLFAPGGTGIEEPDATDLAVLAAERALADAGIAGGDIDLLVAATSTPPRITSALAAASARAARASTSAPAAWGASRRG